MPRVWLKEGSPLRVYTRSNLVAARLPQPAHPAPFVVDYAMRYGNPSIPAVLRKLKEQNCQRHSGRADVSAICGQRDRRRWFDSVFGALQQDAQHPALRTIKNFHDHPGYIKALAKQHQ